MKTRQRRGVIYYKQQTFDLTQVKFHLTPLFYIFLVWGIDMWGYFLNCVFPSCENPRWPPSSIRKITNCARENPAIDRPRFHSPVNQYAQDNQRTLNRTAFLNWPITRVLR